MSNTVDLDSIYSNITDKSIIIKSIKPYLKVSKESKISFNLYGGEHGISYGSGTGGSSYGGGYGWGV